MSLPVLEILKHYGFTSEQHDENNVKCHCPFHDDTSRPNCYVEINTGAYNCFACEAGSKDFHKLLARKANKPESTILQELAHKFGVSQDKTIDVKVVEKHHRALLRNNNLRKPLYHRGLTDPLIVYYRIGCDVDRITIPIKNTAGYYVNIRKYKPDAITNKFKSLKGRGQQRLYPIEQLHFETIVFTGGEIKAIVAAYHLNQHGIGSISGTTGEASLSIDLAKQFHGKTVYVCMDIDSAGVIAAKKVSSILVRYAKKVFITALPLSVEEHPKGDINDLTRVNGCITVADITENSEQYSLQKVVPHEQNGEEIKEVSLSVAMEGINVGKRLKLRGRVTAITDQPYEIPSKVKVDCDKSEPFCSYCPVFHNQKSDDSYAIPCESKAIVSMCNSHEGIQHIELKSAIGIPRQCKVCSFDSVGHYSVQEIRITNVLSIVERDSSSSMQTAYCVGSNLDANSEYTFVGKNFPHQKTQAASFIFSEFDPLADELSSFEGNRVKDLTIFQPKQWTYESIRDKLQDIYDDLEANVTYIYKRRRIHLAVDLAYHSPLQFELDSQLQKGWVEVLIVGDSSIGKSLTAGRLRDHYGVGKRTSCKGATLAGLLGGLQNINGRFFVTWGVIPEYDKQLVILEELKGMSKNALSGLTDMRSSGIAEIPKVERRSTHSRTRLICISNPVRGRLIQSYTFGIESIVELIKAPEDIRRFDLCLAESNEDISSEEITRLQAYRPSVEHKYTSDLSRELILWSWSRGHSQVKFEEGVSELLGEVSNKLCTSFSETCPIIDKGSTRYKVARLAASIAVRTFSHENYGTILVRKCHVEFIYRTLVKIYSETSIGYLRYSEAIKYVDALRDEHIITLAIKVCPCPRDFVDKILHTSIDFTLYDIVDWSGYDLKAAPTLLGKLVRKNAVTRVDRSTYRKTGAFNIYLKELHESGTLPEQGSYSSI